jgi:hypothetical protein
MLDFDSKTMVRALCGCFLLLSACDQPGEPEDQEFRFETNQCVGIGSGSQQFSAGKKGYGPWDDGDPWIPSELPAEWVRAFHEDVQGQTETFLVADFERDGGTADCPRECKLEGMRFDGGGCVASGDFVFEGIEEDEPDYAGTPRYSVEFRAEVQLGCSCVE